MPHVRSRGLYSAGEMDCQSTAMKHALEFLPDKLPCRHACIMGDAIRSCNETVVHVFATMLNCHACCPCIACREGWAAASRCMQRSPTWSVLALCMEGAS
jgi:hypothetical protein